MATVVEHSPPVTLTPPGGPESAGSPSFNRLQTEGDSDEKDEKHESSRSRSERGSVNGEEKHEDSETRRESMYDEPKPEVGSPEGDVLRPSEVMRVGSEIDTFINRNRQASIAPKLRPQASHAILPGIGETDLYDVVTHAVTRKNEGKQLGDEVDPFLSGDPHAASPHNVARLSMSVAQAKAKLDGTSSKALAKHGHQEELDGLSSAVVVEPGTEVLPAKAASPKHAEPDKGSSSSSSSTSSSSSSSTAVGAAKDAAPSHGLPKQASLHMDEAESLALNKQRQASSTSMPPRKELMTTRKSESKQDDDDADGPRAVRILLPARFAPAELATPPLPSKSALKPILKPSPVPYNGLAILQRQEAYIAGIMDSRMKTACKFMKYNLQGKPSPRYFYITQDGTELHWTKTNPAKGRNKQHLTAEKPRKRFFADVRGVYYGPYNNRRVFRRFLDNKDQFEGSGKDWLCITVAFDDRTLDFCCTTDEQVSTWFLCMQALAPLAASYLTCGSVLWRRLIMKLNAYGLNPDRWPGPLKDPPPAGKGGKKK